MKTTQTMPEPDKRPIRDLYDASKVARRSFARSQLQFGQLFTYLSSANNDRENASRSVTALAATTSNSN
jgi:hypothetical protein